MKLKQLQALLEDVEPFAAPRIELEQYATGAHLAARILHTAHGLGDVEARVVVDLGCGCGVLAIASVLMGASHVVRLTGGRTCTHACWGFSAARRGSLAL
jgi:predicted RNA methylase